MTNVIGLEDFRDVKSMKQFADIFAKIRTMTVGEIIDLGVPNMVLFVQGSNYIFNILPEKNYRNHMPVALPHLIKLIAHCEKSNNTEIVDIAKTLHKEVEQYADTLFQASVAKAQAEKDAE